MNRFKAIGSALLMVPALALFSTPARAEFKCNSQAGIFDRVACEKAKEGPSALRRYIERMRIIESLEFSDYVDDAQAAGAQGEAVTGDSKDVIGSAMDQGPEHGVHCCSIVSAKDSSDAAHATTSRERSCRASRSRAAANRRSARAPAMRHRASPR